MDLSNTVMEIDLLQLAKALWRNALVIILVALLFAGVAFGGTYLFISPTYDASVMLYVNSSTVSIGNTAVSVSAGELSTSQSLVSTYIVILKTRTTLEEIIDSAGLAYSPEHLSGMISSSAVSGTSIFRVSVRCGNPVEAELIANTIGKVLPNRISDIIDGTSVRVVDHAIVPSRRSSPSYLKNTGIGLLAGIALAAAFICIKEIFFTSRDSVVDSTEVLSELYPDIPILAVIPDMRYSERDGYYSFYSSYYGSDRREAK